MKDRLPFQSGIAFTGGSSLRDPTEEPLERDLKRPPVSSRALFALAEAWRDQCGEARYKLHDLSPRHKSSNER